MALYHPASAQPATADTKNSSGHDMRSPGICGGGLETQQNPSYLLVSFLVQGKPLPGHCGPWGLTQASHGDYVMQRGLGAEWPL